MQIIYADAGLHGHVGHHPNSCEAILKEVRARQIPLRVLAFAGVAKDLQTGLGAIPFFHHNLYWIADKDPLCGPLYGFQMGAHQTLQDLAQVRDTQRGDILFWPWIMPAQLLGTLLWLSRLPPDRQPTVVANFLRVPDASWELLENKIVLGLPDYRIEPSAMFLRYAAKHVVDGLRSLLRLGYNDRQGVNVLQAVLGLDVQRFPSVQEATTSRRRRSATNGITVGLLGHQRGSAKGVQFIPGLVRSLLATHPHIRFLIHDGGETLPDVTPALLNLAAEDKRVRFQRGAVTSSQWSGLLDEVDLLICPYLHEEYRLNTSGVHNEAIANGIPSVVPLDSTLSRAAMEFCGGIVEFAVNDVESIAGATRSVLDDFDRYAEAAEAGASKWASCNGPSKLMDAVLGHGESETLQRSQAPVSVVHRMAKKPAN